MAAYDRDVSVATVGGLPGEWEVLSISWHKGKTQFYLLIYKYCCVYRHLIDVNIILKLSNTILNTNNNNQ